MEVKLVDLKRSVEKSVCQSVYKYFIGKWQLTRNELKDFLIIAFFLLLRLEWGGWK